MIGCGKHEHYLIKMRLIRVIPKTGVSIFQSRVRMCKNCRCRQIKLIKLSYSYLISYYKVAADGGKIVAGCDGGKSGKSPIGLLDAQWNNR